VQIDARRTGDFFEFFVERHFFFILSLVHRSG
jgi:hypothetical protein